LSTASGGQNSDDADVVRVRRISWVAYVSVVVENRAAYDVTAALTIRGRNAHVTRILPPTGIYAGHSQTEVARVSPIDANQPCRWRCGFHWTKGRSDARHDPAAVYRLPFERGTAFMVGQSYDGQLSHRGVNRYAVDFVMPIGTVVCAAREGVVVDLKESSNAGGTTRGFANKSNYVAIAHADGTIGEYHHLQCGGALVEIGDRVAAGRPIAVSGNTGYSTFPHVHFGVYSAVDAERRRSHPIRFITEQGIVAVPQVGMFYIAR
jgi:murein DD-endopeptidase MepM/ murein hydrolase activator NlpD